MIHSDVINQTLSVKPELISSAALPERRHVVCSLSLPTVTPHNMV